MKLLLDELVVSRDFKDNARPDFLRNPVTEANLEYDRYYRNTAAFEFNGAQHRRPTQRYDKHKYTVTRTHDLIKSGLSTEKNIILIAVTKPDLTIEGMLKLIPQSLKTWPLVEGAYLTAVRESCDEYMKSETGESSA